jgi:hypothetical protein
MALPHYKVGKQPAKARTYNYASREDFDQVIKD